MGGASAVPEATTAVMVAAATNPIRRGRGLTAHLRKHEGLHQDQLFGGVVTSCS